MDSIFKKKKNGSRTNPPDINFWEDSGKDNQDNQAMDPQTPKNKKASIDMSKIYNARFITAFFNIITKLMNQQNVVEVLYLDFSKAFAK